MRALLTSLVTFAGLVIPPGVLVIAGYMALLDIRGVNDPLAMVFFVIGLYVAMHGAADITRNGLRLRS